MQPSEEKKKQIVAYRWTYLILNVNLVQQDATIQENIEFTVVAPRAENHMQFRAR
jgi:hypothetical protein